MLSDLFSGVASKYGSYVDREDAVQNCWLKFIMIYDKLKTSDDCFAYLTSVSINEIRGQYRILKLHPTESLEEINEARINKG